MALFGDILTALRTKSSGNYSISTTYATIELEMIVFSSAPYDMWSNAQWGNTTHSARMLGVRVEGDLRLRPGFTIKANARKRGMCVLIDGDLIIDGKFTMTALGANAVGQRVLFLDDGSEYEIAAAGGTGGVSAVASGTGHRTDPGNNGSNGTGTKMGGGGSGGAAEWASVSTSGAGAGATSYSGGPGGGGAAGDSVNQNGGDGVSNGGAGGNGDVQTSNPAYPRGAGGGAGNGGGNGVYDGYEPGLTYENGELGTGGLIVFFVTGNITINTGGSIESLGSDGGSSNTITHSGGKSGGGGSGGGHISLFYKGSYTNNGSLNVGGGSGGSATDLYAAAWGGSGGNGTTRVQQSNGIPIVVPATVAGLAATDGTYTDKVRVTWNAVNSDYEVTGYDLYYDGSWHDVGNVTTYDHTAAAAGSITLGSCTATDGTYTDKVRLVSGGSGGASNNGATETYYVRAYNVSGTGPQSSSTTGYRSIGSVSRLWYRDTTNTGGSASTYDDTGAGAGSITLGSCTATDGTYTDKVRLVSGGGGGGANNGATYTYKAKYTATGASNSGSYSSTNTGYRSIGGVSRLWYRDTTNTGGSASTYDDTGAAAGSITLGACTATDGSSTAHVTLDHTGYGTNNGTTYTYKAKYTATGASNSGSYSSTNTGYRSVGGLTRVWYRDGGSIGGTTDPYNDTGAAAPTITPGTASASDGSSTAYIALTSAGYGTNNGTTYTYKARCYATGASNTGSYSSTNTGYRGVGSLVRLWYRSAGDSNASYGSIGQSSASYNDTGAPAPTVAGGAANATDGTGGNSYIDLSLSGQSGSNGAGRYYKCYYTATGASAQWSTNNRGYRGVGSLTYLWYMSSGDADSGYSSTGLTSATSNNYTGAPDATITGGTAVASDGSSTSQVTLSISGESLNQAAGRYFKCLVSASGASSQYSTANRGYQGVGSLTYLWYRSAGDSNASYSSIGLTTEAANDTGAPAPTITGGSAAATDGTGGNGLVDLSVSGQSGNNGAGRYYKCYLNASGAAAVYSGNNRGYRGTTTLTYLWYMSSGDSDASYSSIGLTSEDPSNYGGAPDAVLTLGTTIASDGSSTAYSALSLSGTNLAQAAGRYFKVLISMSGASNVYSSANRGYNGVGSLTYLWYRSSGDADSGYASIGGATSSTYNDTGAPAPTITGGSAAATNGTGGNGLVDLSVSGQSGNIGAGRYYKCLLTATGATNSGGYSTANRGYRGTTTLTYLWYMSAGDSNASYSSIGLTSEDPSNYGGAPDATITGGTTVASDGTQTAHVALSIGGMSLNQAAGRYFKVLISMSGASGVYSSANRGYNGVGSLTYQWQRSDADSDANYNTDLGTSSTHNDTSAPAGIITPGAAVAGDGDSTAHISLSVGGESVADGAGRYFRCRLNASGAAQVYSAVNRGYRGTGSITYQWQRSAADSDASYSTLGGATTEVHNDTTAPQGVVTPGTADASDKISPLYVTLSLSGESVADGAGRYYRCILSATGCSGQTTSANRGYRTTGSITYQWQRSAADSDASYSNIDGGTTDPYNDTEAPIDGDGRYFKCVLSATGTVGGISTADRGYRLSGDGMFFSHNL